MKKYIVEFIGTFFLVFTIGMTVMAPGAGNLAPFAIAATFMVMIYAGAHVSGAHFNPAVTLAVWMRGKCPTGDVAPYIISQTVGAIAASFVVKFFKVGLIANLAAAASPMSPDTVPALIAEFIFTFALAWVILNVATARATNGNSYYGAAIAFTVLAGVLAVGGISGGVFNPAVAIGVCMMGIVSWGSIWIYLVACFAGAAAAALVFKNMNKAD